MLSTWSFQVLHASEFSLFTFLAKNQKVRHKVGLWKGKRGMVHKPASCPHQQLPNCYSNKLHIFSDVTDFVQPEAAFVCIGDEGRKLKKPWRAVVTVFYPISSNNSWLWHCNECNGRFLLHSNLLHKFIPLKYQRTAFQIQWNMCFREVAVGQQTLMCTTHLEEFRT